LKNYDKVPGGIAKGGRIATSNPAKQAIEPGHILKAILETDENVPNYLFKK